MECNQKRFLLRQVIESNLEYRIAMQRCRVCRSCSAAAPGERTVCQLDEYLEKFEQAADSITQHVEEHGCSRAAGDAV